MWPFNRKPSEPVATNKPSFPQVFNDYGVRFLSPEEIEWNHKQSLEELRHRFGGEMPPRPLFFDRNDLHARIVQTLTRHAGLNTYELADAIVDEIQGSRS